MNNDNRPPAANGLLAEQIEEWVNQLTRMRAGIRPDVKGVIAGMEEVALDLRRKEEASPAVEEKTRLRRRITVVRYWFEDADYVTARGGNPVAAWAEQVKEEFNGCVVDGTACEGASVLDVAREVVAETHEDGNVTARFDAWLDFEYPDQGRSFASDADVIQHIFYDEGGVAGDFILLGDAADEPAPQPTPLPKHRERKPGLDYDWGRLPVTVAAGGGASGDTIRMVYKGLLDLNADIEWVEDGHIVRHVVRVAAFEQLDNLEPVLIGEMLTDQGDSLCSRVVLRFSSIRSVEVS
ncbi:MAG: hypothetical protein P1V36_00405 [Planctomycetota bacterium]|nr:hypothetical protein [Planctomycetota bacterium]